MPRIALLSTAHIHTPGFVKLIQGRSDVQVAAVYDPNPALAQKWAAELHAPAINDPRKILQDASIDGVVICGTTAQHNDYVVATAQAGKNLFVEKPLAITGTDASRMFSAIKKAGVIYQTGHFLRGSGLNRFIKNEIAAGNLGRITRIRVSNTHSGALGRWFDTDYHWFAEVAEGGGGAFYDLGCHALDLMVYLLGPVTEATGAIGGPTVTYPNVDEYGEGLVRFPNGTIGSLAAGWLDVANPVFLTVSGTEGHLAVIRGQVWYQSQRTQVPGADEKQPLDPAVFPANGSSPLDLFLDVLGGKADRATLIPVEDALHVAQAMEAMYTGSRLGSWVKVN